jgi:hypothetical protein
MEKDYSKCPKCGQQIYIYIGDTNRDAYLCYEANKDLSKGEEIEIAVGSRMDRVDYVEDETFYTCDLAIAQGVLEDFQSDACGEINCKSKQELKYAVDYYSIIKRKQEADNSSIESEQEEFSIPKDWVEKNVESNMFSDEEFAKWALSIDGLLLEYFSSEIRGNLALVTIAVENNSNSSIYIEDEILTQKNNILKLLEVDKDLLSKRKITPELFTDKKFAEDCLAQNGNIVLLDLFPKEYLKDDKILTLAFVNAQDHELLIKGIPEEVKNDIKFWTKILNNNEFTSWGYIYEFLPNEIKSNSAIFNVAIEDNDSSILYAPEAFKTKETLNKIIQKSIDNDNFIRIDIIDMAKTIGDVELNKVIQEAYRKELVDE